MEVTTQHKKITLTELKPVVIYFVLACLFSWPFFWWRDMHPESWRSLNLPHFVKNWLIMWGPGLSSIICLWVFKRLHYKTISIAGTSLSKSLIFYLLPIISLAIVGIDTNEGSSHIIPLALGIMGFISIIGEELGWRGFLQDALRSCSKLKRYIIIGLMWEAWHFTTRFSYGNGHNPAIVILIFSVITILLSFLIGEATDKSKSLIVAVTLHAWVDIIAEFASPKTIIVFCVSLPFWIYMLWSWNRKRVVD